MFHAFAILFVPLLVSVTGLVAGAASGSRPLAAAAAALGGGILILSAWLLAARRARDASPEAADERETARATAALLAVGWGWAGASMLAVYLLSGLKWQHGWQYGSGMVLIGALILAYSCALRAPSSRMASRPALVLATRANQLQALAAAFAVGWLVLSGKLATLKGDWAANDIFLVGGLAIVGLAVVAHVADARRPRGDG